MAESRSLADRIDAEFMAVAEKIKKFQVEQMQEYKDRQNRLEQLGKVFEQLRDIWRPPLELLMKKFGGKIEGTPRIVPTNREATFDFTSGLAHIRLKFSASTDRDIRKLVICYDLQIIPILTQFVPHAEIEFPLDRVDREAVAKWLDDRIIDFVRTYLSLGENDLYLKDQMVEDPIAHVRFPRMAACLSLDWQGQKFYFLGEETRQEFAKQNNISID